MRYIQAYAASGSEVGEAWGGDEPERALPCLDLVLCLCLRCTCFGLACLSLVALILSIDKLNLALTLLGQLRALCIFTVNILQDFYYFDRYRSNV